MSNTHNRAGIALAIVFLTAIAVVVAGLIVSQAEGGYPQVVRGIGLAAPSGGDEVYDARDYQAVQVDMGDVSIVFLPSEDGDIHVTLPWEADIRVNTGGSTLSFRQREGDWWRGFGRWSSTQETMYVYVPDGFSFVGAQSASGSVDVDGIRCGGMVVGSASGRVSLADVVCTGDLFGNSISGAVESERLTAERITLKSTSGRVEAYGLEAKDIELETISGRIEAETIARCSLRANTVSGRMDLDLREAANGKVSTISGNVSLMTSGEQTVRCSTVSGDVRLEGNRVSGRSSVLQRGEDSLEVSTTSGNIDIERTGSVD